MPRVMIFIEVEDFEFRDICPSCREVHYVHKEAGLCLSCFQFAIESASKQVSQGGTN